MKKTTAITSNIEEVEAILRKHTEQPTFELIPDKDVAGFRGKIDGIITSFAVNQVNNMISSHFGYKCKLCPGTEGDVIIVFDEPEKQPRMFEVETPVGKLLVWAKADYGNCRRADCEEDEPGVYIDLLNGQNDPQLAVIEYSEDKTLQCCLYQDTKADDPYVYEYDI